ncbi:MAG: uridine diphosphate-N-acetylglucosamine-binding protein YvcK [bacterium]
MYKIFLPGIRIKRWIFLSIFSIFAFAIGFSFITDPRLISNSVWDVWTRLTTKNISENAILLIGLGIAIIGVTGLMYGVNRLINIFTFLANPALTPKQLLKSFLSEKTAPTLKVVGLGGGTGLSTVLRGLKEYPLDISAIVTVSDDGGSSGRLRSCLNIPPPGDIRNCMVALAQEESVMEKIFSHRFTGDCGELHGHNLGNLIIAGLGQINDDFYHGIKDASQVLAIRGRVLPATNKGFVLQAIMNDGTVVEGETAITAHPAAIDKLSIITEDIQALPESIDAIREADIIIVGPGSVYTSIIPNFLVPGISEEIAKSKAMKFFICNVMTQPGESDDFSASAHLQAVLNQLSIPNPFDYIVVNIQKPAADILEMYRANNQNFVTADIENCIKLGSKPVLGEFLAEAHLARHNPAKLARVILEKVAENMGKPLEKNIATTPKRRKYDRH